MHHRKRTEKAALCRTVESAWKDFQPIKLTNVYRRWKLVLDLIIEDNGGDALVESRRKKLYREPSEEAEDLNNDENAAPGNGIDETAISSSEIDALDHDCC